MTIDNSFLILFPKL